MAKFHYRESPTEKQKKVFAKYLSEDEELVLVTGLSNAYLRSKFCIYLLFPGIIFGVLGFGLAWILKLGLLTSLVIALTLMAIFAILKTLHTYHSRRYLLTTSRVIIKKGLFSVTLSSALFDKITHIEVIQGFVDRIFFHHGRIVVNTAGMNKGEISLDYVDYPIEIKNLLERSINREREQLGLRGTPLTTVEGEVIS
ncbi:PH domain-containing protein [Candidatus Daviesbacteria bacterium]|nr:PH domain-containing protein [Candidatus Daviesbacteria bacterium]